jgi:WD40 repeat protein
MSGVSEAASRGKSALAERFRIATSDYVLALDIAQNGELAVVGLGAGLIIGLHPRSGKQLFSTLAHEKGLLGLSVSPDGQSFVTCGQDEVAKIWNQQGALQAELPGGGGSAVEQVAWAPVGSKVATASGKTIRVWSTAGTPLTESGPLASTTSGLAWRSDGTGLSAACYGGVHVWPFIVGAKERHLEWKGSLISLAWSPDAKVIACASQDKSVHFWRLSSGLDAQMGGYRFKPKALAWDRESRLLATAGDAALTVSDFRGKGPEGTEPLQLEAHHGLCTTLAFSPVAGWLASGSQDTSVILWDPRRTERPLRYAFLDDEVTCLRWHPQQSVLFGADATGTVCAWHVA